MISSSCARLSFTAVVTLLPEQRCRCGAPLVRPPFLEPPGRPAGRAREDEADPQGLPRSDSQTARGSAPGLSSAWRAVENV